MANEKSRAEVATILAAKAANDAEFRKQLKSNPRAVVEKELGRPLPANFEFKVVENTAASQYIVLPWMASKELSAEDVAAVAGGVGDTAWRDAGK
jgi:hypothetical protein